MAVEELLPPASAKPAQDISSAFRDPILIAALPAAAYWFAFKYETGYLGAYGLPPYLAEVSLQSTMLWLLAVLTIAFIWFVLVNVLMMLWPEKLSIRRKLAPFGMLALFVLWQLFAFGFRRQGLPVYVGTIGVLAVLERLSFKYPRSTPEPKSAIDWLAENLVEPV